MYFYNRMERNKETKLLHGIGGYNGLNFVVKGENQNVI